MAIEDAFLNDLSDEEKLKVGCPLGLELVVWKQYQMVQLQ